MNRTEVSAETPPSKPPAAPSRSEPTIRPSGWTGGRITAVVIGFLLGLIAIVLLAAGGTALWADRTQRDAGYVTTEGHDYASTGSALATDPSKFGAGTAWLHAPSLLGEVRIRVTPVGPRSDLFVGIGPSADVDRYLAGVGHTVVSDIWRDRTQDISGGAPASAPAAHDFWVASSSGAGARTVVWKPVSGSWTVVVMNADGRPGVAVRADLGARMPAAVWIAVGLLVAGAIFALGAALLIAGAIRGRRADRMRAA